MYMKIHLSMLYDSLVDSFVEKLQVLGPENINVTKSHNVNRGFTKIMTTVTINVHYGNTNRPAYISCAK